MTANVPKTLSISFVIISRPSENFRSRSSFLLPGNKTPVPDHADHGHGGGGGKKPTEKNFLGFPTDDRRFGPSATRQIGASVCALPFSPPPLRERERLHSLRPRTLLLLYIPSVQQLASARRGRVPTERPAFPFWVLRRFGDV